MVFIEIADWVVKEGRGGEDRSFNKLGQVVATNKLGDLRLAKESHDIIGKNNDRRNKMSATTKSKLQ